MGNKIIQVLVVVIGLLTLVAPLMGCEPRTPALSAAEVQAQQLRESNKDQEQQWREINKEQAQVDESSRRLICLKSAARDPFAMLAQLALKITCKSGE